MNRVPIKGLRVDNVTMGQALAACLDLLARGGAAAVYTPNAEMAKSAFDDPSFLALLNGGDLVIPDGAGLVLASKILRRPLQAKVPGVDLAEQLLPLLAQRGARLFLLGGRPGVAQKATEIMARRHPNLVICGVEDGYFTNEASVVERIVSSGTQVVYVCLGSPKQEQFIYRHKEQCNALMLGLGGTLDVLSGEARRAPVFYQKCNLEWLYRGALDPRRWRRLMKIPAFLWDVLRSKREPG